MCSLHSWGRTWIEHGHLDVPADYTDPTGYRLGTFITTMRDARTAAASNRTGSPSSTRWA
ncbi:MULTISPECIES: helicase associated domain-containing protein [unclassified Streptomyces]|uniref:helicase associated domain-containing protein n=1 Tax=unclassified Streptomyces TaxID=2593676 RepID=UPI0036C6D90B